MLNFEIHPVETCHGVGKSSKRMLWHVRIRLKEKIIFQTVDGFETTRQAWKCFDDLTEYIRAGRYGWTEHSK